MKTNTLLLKMVINKFFCRNLLIKFLSLILISIFYCINTNYLYAQNCVFNGFATSDSITCGSCTELSAFGYSLSDVCFTNDFNDSTAGTGWNPTPAATFTNPCGPGIDGTIYMWMGDATPDPRSITTEIFNLSMGGTICFDLVFATQTGDPNDAPCEGPDEPDEGVHLQYSTDSGITWIDIYYFDPVGGFDPELTSWNNYCFILPPAAQTANTMIKWWQNSSSGYDYDHWGIDNVTIALKDTSYYIEWFDGTGGNIYTNNPVCPTTSISYDVILTNGIDDSCYASIPVTVVPPNIIVSASPDTTICSGQCVDLTGEAYVLVSPGGQPTFENNETQAVESGDASVNINIQDLNMTQILAGSILEVCINGFTFSGMFICTEFGGCDCNGTPISFGETCNLDVSGFDVTLITPDSCEILLVPNGVATGTEYADVCFIPSGGADINSGGFPSPGNWDPSEPFDNLVGCDANGVWTLNFNAPGGLGFGMGILTGWSITFDHPEIAYLATFDWLPTTDMANETTLNPTVCPSGTGNYVYTLTAYDSAGCSSQQDVVTVNVIDCGPCTMTASITSGTDVLCYGDCDGSATVSPVGGNSPYTYVWDDSLSQTTATAINLCAGTYNVTVTDSDTCTATAFVTITEPPLLTIIITGNAPSDSISCDGSATVVPSGGIPPYWYFWSIGDTSQTITNLCQGTYCVTVTDANFCTASDCILLNDSTVQPLIANITGTNVLCNGDTTGTADLTVTNGTPPYTYNWSNSETTEDIVNLVAGIYCVTVTDSILNTATACVTITEPPVLTSTGTTTDETSPGACDGTIDLTPSGGTGIYTFIWSNSETTEDISELCSDTYTVTITDANGCTTTNIFTISSGSCNADFTITPEYCQNCFSFIDNSTSTSNIVSWFWDFDDGNTSILQNPIHTYTDSGYYYVCLTIITDDTCTDTHCDSVYVQYNINIYLLSGNVFAGMDLLSSGTAELYYSDSSANAVYTTDVTNGSYYFSSVAGGNYKLLAIPDYPESDNYSSTYFGNVIAFNDAYSIPLFANTYSVDIHLQESSGIFDLNSSNSIKIFPNPVIDVLFVVFATDLENSVVPFTIFNYQGQRVEYGIIKNNSIKVNKLEDGIYFISFIKDAHYYTSKFIKIN